MFIIMTHRKRFKYIHFILIFIEIQYFFLTLIDNKLMRYSCYEDNCQTLMK